MGYRPAAVAFRYSFEQLTNPEKEHDEDRLGILGFGAIEKADRKGSDGGDRHEEVFIQSLSVDQAFGSLFQRIESYYKIRYKEKQKILPLLPCGIFLNDDGYDKKKGRNTDADNLLTGSALFVVMMMSFLFGTVMMVMFFFMAIAGVLIAVMLPQPMGMPMKVFIL